MCRFLRLSYNFLYIKHSGLVIKPPHRKVALRQKEFTWLTKSFYDRSGNHMYSSDMSPGAPSCCSFPWPFTTQSTTVIKPQSPNLLSLYEPLPCHAKKEILVAHSLNLMCAPPASGRNQISAPLHACPLTRLLLPPPSAPLLDM